MSPIVHPTARIATRIIVVVGGVCYEINTKRWYYYLYSQVYCYPTTRSTHKHSQRNTLIRGLRAMNIGALIVRRAVDGYSNIVRPDITRTVVIPKL